MLVISGVAFCSEKQRPGVGVGGGWKAVGRLEDLSVGAQGCGVSGCGVSNELLVVNPSSISALGAKSPHLQLLRVDKQLLSNPTSSNTTSLNSRACPGDGHPTAAAGLHPIVEIIIIIIIIIITVVLIMVVVIIVIIIIIVVIIIVLID